MLSGIAMREQNLKIFLYLSLFMTNTHRVLTFLGEQTPGLAGEITHLNHSFPNKRPSHVFTTVFSEEEFITFHRRSFYIQSAVINTMTYY